MDKRVEEGGEWQSRGGGERRGGDQGKEGE
jgi:hypothetical protein